MSATSSGELAIGFSRMMCFFAFAAVTRPRVVALIAAMWAVAAQP
jgi:hypothetical protein